MSGIRCLIVDDEPLACESLRAVIETVPELEVLGEVHRVRQAVEMIEQLRPDLLFLDIQMPGGGGFEVLRRLKEPPAVIFVTAHDEYAIRAFEVNAVDYLLKPVSLKRLTAAVGRLGSFSDRQTHPLKIDDHALLEIGGSGVFAAVQDILLIEAKEKYSEVSLASHENVICRQSIREWIRRLPAPTFLQVTRGLIVNVEKIRSLEFADRRAVLHVGDKMLSVEVGRTGAERLRDWSQTANSQ